MSGGGGNVDCLLSSFISNITNISNTQIVIPTVFGDLFLKIQAHKRHNYNFLSTR